MIIKTLGNFECTALLGKGGMGEVYQAKDQKLGRDVAIKVLPEEFAKDADRVARFQREAKLLASLNHPNIAAIYGLEESEGTHFLVLELVEGDTLADRLKRGAIPIEESLKLALQIAEALEAAHEKGVIHRDLKPANIKVTPDGKVKVLDFGLAKAFAGDQGDMDLSNSPTLSAAATQQGVILGTAAYMSPEQAKGKPVDKRTDIWAFGVVLYEMLTGRPLFAGEDVSSTLARVLEREPDYSVLPKNLHPRIRFLFERCLVKNAKDRYGVVSDARVDIQQVLADPGGVFVQPMVTAEPRKRMQTIIPWIGAALVLGAIIAGMAVWNLRTPEPKQIMRFEYQPPEDQDLGVGGFRNRAFAISPDGRRFVYATHQGLYLRSMDELNARPIAGMEENAQNPFFSPDGQWIGYLSGPAALRRFNKLKKISVNRGEPISIADIGDISGFLSWCEDDAIVYASGANIMRISANGGDPELLVEGNGEAFLAPQILPDGETIMFTAGTDEGHKIVVQSLETGEQNELIEGNTAQYLSTGHIVYANENNLFAVPFDLDRLEKTGVPILMVEGIYQPTGAPQYAVSDSGTLIYIPGRGMGNIGDFRTLFLPREELVWVGRQGKVEEIAVRPDYYEDPGISPDGTKIALTVSTVVRPEEPSSDIYIWDLNREIRRRLTFNDNSSDPLWTPNGQRVVFVAGDESKRGIYWTREDGTGKDELLALMPEGEYLRPNSWSSDGKILVATKSPRRQESFRMGGPPQGGFRGMRGFGRGKLPKRPPRSEGSSTREETGFSVDIGTLSMEGDHAWKPLLHLEDMVMGLQVSPGGRWMAYSSAESENMEVYVRPFPDVDSGGRWQVSTDGGFFPLWSPDGREIFYISNDGSYMAVDVETEPTFKHGKPIALFKREDSGFRIDEMFGISPDGKRFLMMKESTDDTSTEETSRPKINIVLNWFEELKDRVPVK